MDVFKELAREWFGPVVHDEVQKALRPIKERLEKLMATVQDVRDAVDTLKADTSNALADIANQIEDLKSQIPDPAALDGVLQSVRDLDEQVKAADPVPGDVTPEPPAG